MKTKPLTQSDKRNSSKLVILDIGGVVLDYSDSVHYAKIAQRIGVNQALFTAAADQLVVKMEDNTITLGDAKRILAKKFDVNASDIKWEEEFVNNSAVNKPMLELANKLFIDHRIAIASNISIGDYVRLFSYNGILKELRYDKMFASCYMRIRKPDPQFYKSVLRTMRSEPENAIFIDDRPKNLEGAAKLGITSIQFTDTKNLISQLDGFLR